MKTSAEHSAIRPRDTSPDAFEVQLLIYRQMTPGQKLAQANALIKATRRLARAGLRSRHPDASEEELRKRFAALVLDAETVRKVYGWDVEAEGY